MTLRLIAPIIGVFWFLGADAMAPDGLMTVSSNYGPKETINRLETEVMQKA